MCGIAGFIGEDRPKIEAITRALVHRGPDGNACEVGHGISLGHARLAILDPRPEGNQPMWNDEKSVVIVYNGEIFNYRELRNHEGFRCITTTDTEVLLKLYERYGMAFIPRLRGMFAFAIYDTKSSTLHLARDSSGIKPLYLTYVDGKPYFASEMRALMRGLDRRPDLNLKALSLYLRLQYVPGPETLAKGIESVPPGTVISWSQDTEKRFWMEPDTPKITIGSKKQAATDLPALMQQVVTDHLISDKPVGVFLSGGMDSSIVLHHMAAAINGPVKTFTVRFEATEEEDARRFNRDADLARLTASYYGTDHEELLLTAEDFRKSYRSTACALDLPNADSVSVAQYALAAKAKKKVDVVLCGAGGDELFGGYPRYRVARILELMNFIPAGLRSWVGELFGYPGDVLKMSPGPALAERLLARPIDEGCAVTRGDWFDPAATTRLFIQRFENVKNLESLRQFMEVDRHLWLVDESLKLADAVTMASGLECRVPFLDPRVIAFSHGTPARWHVGLKRTKAFLKDTYRRILPEHLFSLPKSSFYPPLAKWLRRESGPLAEEMLEGKRIREFFNVERVREIYDRHLSRERYGLSALSTLIQLHNWFETVYDAPP